MHKRMRQRHHTLTSNMIFDVVHLIIYFLLALFGVFWYRTHFSGTSSKDGTALTPLEVVPASPHRHSCQYCQSINITLSNELISTNHGALVRLNLTFAQVSQPTARDCPLLRDAHSASTAALSLRIWCHLQAFFDVFSTHSDLHAFTGCKTFLERARYSIRGLRSRPFHIRFGHMQPESGGSLYARVLYTSWQLFDFDISADQGDGLMDKY